MINGRTVLAVIPARSGSKGLKDKNIRPLAGKPLIAWTIEVAKESSLIDEIIVSTDSLTYKRIAEQYGASVPFIRPKDLSKDTSSSVDVILHSLDYMKGIGTPYSIVVMLEPTSPLRILSDIDEAISIVARNKAKSAVGICRAESSHPSFLFKSLPNGFITPYEGVFPNNLRRQDISPVYYLEGSVYASDTLTFYEKRAFYHEETSGVEIPYCRSFEIDTDIDFQIVEALLKNSLSKS